jgi:hypothetical protein
MPENTENPSILVRNVFFDEAHIEHTAELCVRALSNFIDDPLTVFGNVAIRSPISCTLTQDGLLPFSSDLRILIPFSSMTVAQLQTVRSISCNTDSVNTIRYKHKNGKLTVSYPHDTNKVLVDAALVLFAINALIIRTLDGHNIHTSTVINVTQQRIIASINVHRSQLARADSLTRAYVAARAQTSSASQAPTSQPVVT